MGSSRLGYRLGDGDYTSHASFPIKPCQARCTTRAVTPSTLSHLFLNVVGNSGVRADAVLLHLGDEVGFRQARGRLGLTLGRLCYEGVTGV